MITALVIALMVGLLLLVVVAGAKPSQKGRPSRFGTPSRGSLDRELVARKWATVETMVAGHGSSLRDAVSEADKLLDYALRQSGARGDTMGERLKSSGSRFSDLDSIWRAHKLRNALAHEAEFDLVAGQAREAIRSFEHGLRDLGAL